MMFLHDNLNKCIIFRLVSFFSDKGISLYQFWDSQHFAYKIQNRQRNTYYNMFSAPASPWPQRLNIRYGMETKDVGEILICSSDYLALA